MKKIYLLLVAMICMFSLGLSFNKIEATSNETVFYTLNPVANTSNTSYSTPTNVTINNIKWSLQANQQSTPWKIGGKNGTFDRTLKSTQTINETISSINVDLGTMDNITINKLTLKVYSGNNAIDTLIKNTFSASSTVNFVPSQGVTWNNCSYEFIFNVSISGTSNKYVQLNKIDFLKRDNSSSGSTETGNTGTNVSLNYNLVEITSANELKSLTGKFVIGSSETDLVTSISNSDDIMVCSNVSSTVTPIFFSIEKDGDNIYIKSSENKYLSTNKDNLSHTSTKESWGITDYTKTVENVTYSGIRLTTSDSNSRGLLYRTNASGIKNYSYVNATASGYSIPKFYKIDYTSNINAFKALTPQAGLYLYTEESVNKYDIRIGCSSLGDAYIVDATYGVMLVATSTNNVDNFNTAIVMKNDSTNNIKTLTEFCNVLKYFGISYNKVDSTTVHNSSNANHEFYWRVNDVYGHKDYKFYAIMYMEISGEVYFSNAREVSVNDVAQAYYNTPAIIADADIKARLEEIINGGTN